MFDAINAGLQWLNDTTLAETIRDSLWLFPAMETVHVIAIVFVVGSITRLDLRLMGLIQRHRSVTELSEQMLPYTWTGFAVASVFGLLLWSSKPLTYLAMAFFDVKLVLMALAGVNMLFFQFVIFRNVDEWDRASIPPFSARFAGAMSIAFWVSVVICGRFIGFV
jgi:hypothetical protein